MATITRPPSLLRWRETVHPLRLVWRWFCFGVVRAFYRRAEVRGQEYFPSSGPVLLCANHPSALADAVVIQAASTRVVHPLARSGLFKNPLVWPVLAIIQAVPIYRRQDSADTSRNEDSFARCFEMLAAGEPLLIFPEGESHSDPRLRELRTGAARLALGASARSGAPPLLLPVGLNYTDVGRFRSSVLVKFGRPMTTEAKPGESPDQTVARVTAEIRAALERITLNPNSWAELEGLRRLERFFALRSEKYRRRSLDQRFRALRKLLEAQQRLRLTDPERVERMRSGLDRFERLCARVGIHDYHLTIAYTPALVGRFVARSLAMLLLALPLGAWGAANSFIPFALTKFLAVRLASDRYQYDTAKILLGMAFFAAFWGGQVSAVWQLGGASWALAYAAGLLPTTMIALYMRRERERILDNIRVFFLFLRREDLRQFLLTQRRELEQQIRQLVFLALQRPKAA